MTSERWNSSAAAFASSADPNPPFSLVYSDPSDIHHRHPLAETQATWYSIQPAVAEYHG